MQGRGEPGLQQLNGTLSIRYFPSTLLSTRLQVKTVRVNTHVQGHNHGWMIHSECLHCPPHPPARPATVTTDQQARTCNHRCATTDPQLKTCYHRHAATHERVSHVVCNDHMFYQKCVLFFSSCSGRPMKHTLSQLVVFNLVMLAGV